MAGLCAVAEYGCEYLVGADIQCVAYARLQLYRAVRRAVCRNSRFHRLGAGSVGSQTDCIRSGWPDIGVDGPISGSEVRVVVADGAIAVDGDYSSLVIYDVVGRKVGSASPCFVPSGVYLVMVDKNVFKITVK